jgi:hypothetical protein
MAVYINQHWTPEIIHLMIEKCNEEIFRLNEAAQSGGDSSAAPKHRVSDLELFRRMGLPVQEEGRA